MGKRGEDTHRFGDGVNQQKHEKHQFIEKKCIQIGRYGCRWVQVDAYGYTGVERCKHK